MFSLFRSVLFLTFFSCCFFLFTILLSFSYSLACFCVRNAVNTDFTDKHMGLKEHRENPAGNMKSLRITMKYVSEFMQI